MAIVNLPGISQIEWPNVLHRPSAGTSTNATMNASGHILAVMGPLRVEGSATGTKSINRVAWNCSAATVAGGSRIQVGIRALDVLGNPARPTSTELSSYLFTLAVTNAAVNITGIMSSLALSIGSYYAVTFSFVPFAGADSMSINSIGTIARHPTQLVRYDGTSWSVPVIARPAVILEFTDGTIGQLGDNEFWTAYNTHTYHSGSTPDEVAMRIKLPVPVVSCGAKINISTANDGTDFQVVLYDANGTGLATTVVDGGYRNQNNNLDLLVPWPATTLTANTTYYVSVKPTQNTQSVSVYSLDSSTTLLSGIIGAQAGAGKNFAFASRTDAGAWTADKQRRIVGSLLISGLDDGTGTTTTTTGISRARTLLGH